MRQALNSKKKALCEKLAGRKYAHCTVRGGGAHFWAVCQWAEPHPQGLLNADYVNYKTGEVEPYARDGKFVAKP